MDIAIYIAQNNPTRALTFIDELEGKCDALGMAPDIGTAQPELGEGMCMLPSGRYIIFYRPMNRALRIERIMHGARLALQLTRPRLPSALRSALTSPLTSHRHVRP